jgi:hypothetical protein
VVRWRVTWNDDDPAESPRLPQEDTPPYRIWRYLDPRARTAEGRKGMTLEAWLIGIVLIAVWVNAVVFVWRNLLG